MQDYDYDYEPRPKGGFKPFSPSKMHNKSSSPRPHSNSSAIKKKPRTTHFDLMAPLRDAMTVSDLTGIERLVLWTLYSRMDKHGVCFPSYARISKEAGIADRTAKKAIKSLVEKTWLTYKKGSQISGKANEYKLDMNKLDLTQVKIRQETKTAKIPALSCDDGDF
ncbi:helix-turn-helix domain-containing protein [Photobacterium profundum]|uniref:Helix-turn-helix domain-containing protein n=1 Tax=Photobacterium profundum 3TCK TaxID=314280 RepID=Q1Z7I5_9GAMM|nr:helix-turn-helix domain-containing protein [Photobacterium profundum]EAS44474.1 hypothetical protein P3TCK_14995 [Photobacterium profundum 3TCK]PSV64661.1 helix-turn-helix domain-containing protein [Photobacterium profundum]